MSDLDIREMKNVRFLSIFSGIVMALVGTYCIGFGGMIVYLGMRNGINGEWKDFIILVLIGVGVMLLSLCLWKAVSSEFKKVKQLKQYIDEHEEQIRRRESEKHILRNRGRILSRGLTALAAGIFGIVWMIDTIENGVPIYFALFGMFIAVVAGVQAVHDFKTMIDFETNEGEYSDAAVQRKYPATIKKRIRSTAILIVVLVVYDIISGCIAMAKGMSAKVLPLFLLCNAVMILGVIVQGKYSIKRAEDQVRQEHNKEE